MRKSRANPRSRPSFCETVRAGWFVLAQSFFVWILPRVSHTVPAKVTRRKQITKTGKFVMAVGKSCQTGGSATKIGGGTLCLPPNVPYWCAAENRLHP